MPKVSKFSEKFLQKTLAIEEANRWGWNDIFEYFEIESVENGITREINNYHEQMPQKPNYEEPIPVAYQNGQPLQNQRPHHEPFFEEESNRMMESAKGPKHRPRNILANFNPLSIPVSTLHNVNQQENPRFFYFVLGELLTSGMNLENKLVKDFLGCFFL